MRKGLLACVVATLVIGTATMVLATIPDALGKIHACYNASGALRVSDAACGTQETSLTWDQQALATAASFESNTTFTSSSANEVHTLTAGCGNGGQLTGGGSWADPTEVVLIGSRPFSAGGWEARFLIPTAGTQVTLRVYAVCMVVD